MDHLKSGNLWFSSGLCFVRLTGDLCLVSSTPLLIYKLHKNGTSGISVETQILRLLMHIARYLDFFVFGHVVSEYNTWMKIIITMTSLHMVLTLLFRHKAYSLTSIKDGKYRLGLPFLFAACIAPLVAYQLTFIELAWAFSVVLGSVVDIPQLILLFDPENRDWMLTTYVGLLAGYRAFYIPHWVLRYFDWGVVDPIAVGAGVSETIIFAMAFVAIGWRSFRRRQLKLRGPEDGFLSHKTSVLFSADDPVEQSSDIPGDVKSSKNRLA